MKDSLLHVHVVIKTSNLVIFTLSLCRVYVPQKDLLKCVLHAGVDPRFFLGRGAALRNDIADW